MGCISIPNKKQILIILFFSLWLIRLIYNDGTTTYVDIWRVDTSFSLANIRPFTWIIPSGAMIFLFYPFYKRVGMGLTLIPKKLSGIVSSVLSITGILLLTLVTNDSPKEVEWGDLPLFSQCLFFLIGLLFGTGNAVYNVSRRYEY